VGEMMTLVTGSDGLVGSALQRLLKDESFYFANRNSADLTDFDSTLKLFRAIKPARVIHLAALVGGIGGNLMHSGEYFRTNILINLNVLEAAREVGVQKLVSFMSTCIFPQDSTYPLTVEQLHLGSPHPSNFGYAYAKRMLEVQSRAYREQWGLDYVVAIPTNIYGPNDNWSLTEGHVVPSLIHRAYLAKENNQPLTVWGTGNPLREFIYSADVANLAIRLLDSYSSPNPIILTSGIETSIGETVSLISEAMGFDGDIIYDSSKPDGQYRKPSDPSALKEFAPDFAFTLVKDGIDQTVDWFLSNYPHVRL
jgi:GDP-L-fucose synthase